MLRKVLFLCAALYFVALALLALFLHQASPGPRSQEIVGVSLGQNDSNGGAVYFSGRRLRCSELADDPTFVMVCKIEIAGKTLEIRARRNPLPNIDGVCAASYDGRQRPCQIAVGSAGALGFAFIEDSLGLDKAQLDALRREYFFENLPQEPFFLATFALPVVTAMLVTATAGVWLWPGARRKLEVVPVLLIVGVISLVGTFVFALSATGGFWD